MIATIQTGTLSGVSARAVRVEVSPVRGIPGIDIVGLPEAAVRESRVRVRAALTHSGLTLPEKRFVVNLAPADLRKTGSSFDLAIAIGLLAASGLCAHNQLEHTLFVGELSLDGSLLPTRGVLPQLADARKRKLSQAIVPAADAGWAGLHDAIEVRVAAHLRHVVRFLDGVGELERARLSTPTAAPEHPLDLRDVRGHAAAKRALEIAAAGQHHMLLFGPPGTGKTMLAARLGTIMPAPDAHEALQIATIASAAGGETTCAFRRPFRAPHHSASSVALIGGGDPIRPGEVTLAHGGVLFLDELPEFPRAALEGLRPTMESGRAEIVRAKERVSMPAAPLVVAAMNPCPCGYAGDETRVCRCGPGEVQRYRARLSGPLLDRFDLHVALHRIPARQLVGTPRNGERDGESSADVRARVERARQAARLRMALTPLEPTRTPLERAIDQLEPGALGLLHRSVEQLGLSLRAYAKVLRVARTIADLEGETAVGSSHVLEAIHYRLLDRHTSDDPMTPTTTPTATTLPSPKLEETRR